MEKREVVSVVKIIPHETKKNLEILKMNAAGILDGVSIPMAMELISDYSNLERIAPEYIKKSELIVRKKREGRYQKYLHIKIEVKTLLANYAIEVYARVYEEITADQGAVYWEIIPAKEVGRKLEVEKFVGLKGVVAVQRYQRVPSSEIFLRKGGRGLYRGRAKKNQLMVLFKGALEKEDMSYLIPNFMLQFAMEVALQRVGVLLRNYLETAKEPPRAKDLESMAEQESKLYPANTFYPFSE